LELKQKTWVKLMTHLLVWLVLFSLPYLLSSGQFQTRPNILVHVWIPLVFYALLFYGNYYFLIEKLFFQDKVALYLVINMIAITLLIFINQEIKDVLSQRFDMFKPPMEGPPKRFFIYRDIVSFIVPIIFAFGFKLSEHWFKTESERKMIENQRLQAELQQLKYQLQPHFFFNSLNNIYSMIEIAPDKAKQTIHTLSKLMRYLFNDADAKLVPLKSEITFMTQYIEIMKLRFSDKTKVSYEFPNLQQEVMIPSLLFISLIENAFKHGVSATTDSEIRFEMKLIDNWLVFTSSNTNFAKDKEDKSGSGIGLNNVKKQLALLFPDKHQLEVVDDPHWFKATLKIQL